MPEEVVVQTRGLSKQYGTVQALKAVDVEVRQGEIFGLIGADGAGKTSLFRILAGVLAPTSGEATVLGEPPRQARARVGYVTQPFSLYQDLSVMENMDYAAGLREVPASERATRQQQYFRAFDLERFRDRLAGQLSGGMKQKLALSCALIANPALLLLDEPTAGVDPVTRRDFWDTLTTLAGGGMTIIVATPYLDEAERCHRVALLERGTLSQTAAPAEFRAQLGLTRLEVYAEPLSKAEQEFARVPQVKDVQRFGDHLDVLTPDPQAAEEALRAQAQASGLQWGEVRRSAPTLENAFVAKLREARGSQQVPPFPQPAAPVRENKVVIGAQDLQKNFGSFQAVKHFRLEVRNNDIYGLLGANGAGKTTAIKMMCGLVPPTSGTVSLLGQTKGLRGAAVRSRIGYMSQKFTLYDDLSIGENLDFYARLYGISDRVREARKQWVLQLAELTGEEKMLTGSLPGGWKQRVAFGAAVMHEPEAIFLDEPTSGVDPLARRAMWRMINELADRGAGILVVTHYLEEAEQCNRLGFMVAGELIAEGSPSEVKSGMKGQLLEVATDQPQRALQLLRDQWGSSRVSLFGDKLHVVLKDGEQDQLAPLLQREGVRLMAASPIRFSLEDVFISLIESRREAIPA